MRNKRMTVRLWIVAVVLLGGTALLHGMSHGEAIVAHKPLIDLPYTIADWSGTEQPLDQLVLHAVSVTDYTNRVYYQSGEPWITLYVGYYASQRTGDTIHSPKNCLPGSGWDPVRSDYASITLDSGRKIVVNEYVVQQGMNKDLVFYWYQGRGRVIASEYWGKFWMIADAITKNRTDGALVRLITPITQNSDAAQAHARLVTFTKEIFPDLNKIIPN